MAEATEDSGKKTPAAVIVADSSFKGKKTKAAKLKKNSKNR
jgi:hypothetical protein